MSIRRKILLGCLALTLLTGLTGLWALRSDQQLGSLALEIYDDAFMAVSYLRSAQLGFAGLAVSGAGGQAGTTTGEDVLADLDVAVERAMSPSGRAQAQALRSDVARVLPLLAAHREAAAPVQASFERVVETFADDGYRYRRRVETHVRAQVRQTGLISGVSLLAALVITVLVSHFIVPPVRRAVRIAQAVAQGRLDNTIDLRGRGETADLLRALAIMQASIKALMDAQTASHAGEIAVHNARMAAALDNMRQGLCLFDARDKLLVANRSFHRMFGAAPIGAPLVDLLTTAGLAQLIPASTGQVEPLPAELPDGRIVAVSQAPVAGGGRVATYDDVTERRASEARLAYMARHDLLTGLPNRLALADHVKAAFGRPLSDRLPAMLCLNIDEFRVINNTLGPTIGDALLVAVAERLRADLRGDHDALFRLGGDEFAVVQDGGSHKNDITALAERLIARLAAPFVFGPHRLQTTVSIGIARAQDTDAEKPEVLIRCAGLALLQARRQGRGCYCVYTREMDAHLQERRALELELRTALARDEMLVLYQPQVSVGRGISGFEALLRWDHPTRGTISPSVFIPLAEETGLIGALGDWVLRRACADASAWPDGVKVAVNLSPLQFNGRDIAGNVAAALSMSGLPPNRLEMEITEAVMLQSDSQVLPTLNALRAAGVRVALDDFGTGYSSLSYLSRFTFDKIKIDQSFVRGMLERRDCLAIIRSVIGLGRALDMSVIAEGVETQAQCDRLVQEGCTDIQGYLFGRPQPLAALPALFRQHGIMRTSARPNSERAVTMERL